MAIAFLETPRFPDNISYGSTGGPGFKTQIFESHSGLEQRTIQWDRAKARYNVSHGVRDKEDVDDLIAFFYNMNGRACGFRFKDHADYQIVDGALGTGDASTTVFNINKVYTTGAQTYTRRIFKIVSDADAELDFEIKFDGAPIASSAYTVNENTGVVTFSSAPGNGVVITLSCEFDVPCRFDTDEMNVSHDGFLVESWGGIPLVELLLEDA